MLLSDKGRRRPHSIILGKKSQQARFIPNLDTQLVGLVEFRAGFFTGYYSGYGALFSELYSTDMRATGAGFLYNGGRAAVFVGPMIITSLPSSVSLGGTGIIIVVGVAMETMSQLKGQLTQKQYHGFLK